MENSTKSPGGGNPRTTKKGDTSARNHNIAGSVLRVVPSGASYAFGGYNEYAML